MSQPPADPSRAETARVGALHEQTEPGDHDHVTADDALSEPPNPNAGVVVGEPPPARAFAVTALVVLVTLVGVVLLAYAIVEA